MKFLFIVHGNGNGHQTQALALKEELEKYGHSVEKCVLTSSGNTRAGNLLRKEFDDFSKISGFELKYKNGELNLQKTFGNNLLKFPFIIWSLNRINNMIHFYQPDVVISFYDPIYNLTKQIYNLYVPYISIGHMYMFEDENFETPEYGLDFSFLKIYNRITCLDADKIISLSYFPSKNPNLHTAGPILRNSILNQPYESGSDKNVTGYFHNLHDAKLFANAFKKFPQFNVNLFTNIKNKIKTENTTIFPISGKDFIDCVNQSKIFISSCGYESTSESIFLGKKILTMPIRNHIEQQLNSKCLSKKNLVFSVNSFSNIEKEIEHFLFDFESDKNEVEKFRNFVLHARENVVNFIHK